MKSVIFDYVGWMFVVAVVSGVLFYNMLSRTSVRKLRTAVLYGVVTGVMASFAMISAVLPIWLAVVSLLVTIAVIVWSMARWREATLADRRSLRLRSAVCATGLNLLLLWPMTRAFDAFRKGVPVVGAFQTQIAAIIAISAICFVWRTYFKRKRYRRRWILTDIIWGLLVVFAIISLLVSAVKAAPKSKSAKTKAAVETVGQGPIDTIKELFGKLLDSSDEEVAPDDESVAAAAESDDESVAAEVTEESVAAEVTEESDEADGKTAEKVETGKSTEGRVIKCDTYTQVVKDHPEFHVHNYDLILDDIPYNNSYFTESIYEEGDTEDAVYTKFETIIRECPLTFVQFYAAQAAARKTDVLGEYYANNDAEWAKAINAMVQDFFDSPSDFVNHRRVLLDMLANERVGLELKHFDDIKDQFYVDSYTVSGVPRIVVCETHQSGWVLIIWLRTKGDDPRNDVGIGIDTDCGNVCAFYKHNEPSVSVSEVTEIPTEKVPEMPKGYDPPKPTKTPTPTSKPEPTVTPTPTPVPGGGSDPKKDPSKAPKENTERNDDPGTGKATNNGVGATKSAAASESQKASDGGSVADYDRKVEQNRSANAGGSSSSGSGGSSSGSGSSGSSSSGGQKSGGESNKPSRPVPEAKQDNNGNTGNGGSSIDKPTAKTETAVSADTNQSVDASGAAGGMIATPD